MKSPFSYGFPMVFLSVMFQVPLLLHFDVNKTVIQSDSVQMKGGWKSENHGKMLVFHGMFIGNITIFNGKTTGKVWFLPNSELENHHFSWENMGKPSGTMLVSWDLMGFGLW